MSALASIFHSHVFWVGLYAAFKFIFDAAVGSLDSPGINGAPNSARYRFWFKFLNKCAANFSRANASEDYRADSSAAGK